MDTAIIIILLILTLIYYTPSIVAFARGKKNKGAILALNFFLGWTLVGWVVSLVWALTHEEKS